jgi:hypothetical protein
MPMQQLAYSAMLEYASAPGGVQTKLIETLDQDVERIMMSPMTRLVALSGYEGDLLKIVTKRFEYARLDENWSPFTIAEFYSALTNRSREAWSPGGYGDGFGLQAGQTEGFLAGVAGNAVKQILQSLSIRFTEPPTPFDAHYFRNLDWVSKEIWDLPLRNGGLQFTLDQETKDFIRSLYRKQVNGSIGGWIGETIEGS